VYLILGQKCRIFRLVDKLQIEGVGKKVFCDQDIDLSRIILLFRVSFLLCSFD